MDPFTFNSEASYRTSGVYAAKWPPGVGRATKDPYAINPKAKLPNLTEIDIIVRAGADVLGERGFAARFPNMFDKYTTPPTQSFELMKT